MQYTKILTVAITALASLASPTSAAPARVDALQRRQPQLSLPAPRPHWYLPHSDRFDLDSWAPQPGTNNTSRQAWALQILREFEAETFPGVNMSSTPPGAATFADGRPRPCTMDCFPNVSPGQCYCSRRAPNGVPVEGWKVRECEVDEEEGWTVWMGE